MNKLASLNAELRRCTEELFTLGAGHLNQTSDKTDETLSDSDQLSESRQQSRSLGEINDNPDNDDHSVEDTALLVVIYTTETVLKEEDRHLYVITTIKDGKNIIPRTSTTEVSKRLLEDTELNINKTEIEYLQGKSMYTNTDNVEHTIRILTFEKKIKDATEMKTFTAKIEALDSTIKITTIEEAKNSAEVITRLAVTEFNQEDQKVRQAIENDQKAEYNTDEYFTRFNAERVCRIIKASSKIQSDRKRTIENDMITLSQNSQCMWKRDMLEMKETIQQAYGTRNQGNDASTNKKYLIKKYSPGQIESLINSDEFQGEQASMMKWLETITTPATPRKWI